MTKIFKKKAEGVMAEFIHRSKERIKLLSNFRRYLNHDYDHISESKLKQEIFIYSHRYPEIRQIGYTSIKSYLIMYGWTITRFK